MNTRWNATCLGQNVIFNKLSRPTYTAVELCRPIVMYEDVCKTVWDTSTCVITISYSSPRFPFVFPCTLYVVLVRYKCYLWYYSYRLFISSSIFKLYSLFFFIIYLKFYSWATYCTTFDIISELSIIQFKLWVWF